MKISNIAFSKIQKNNNYNIVDLFYNTNKIIINFPDALNNVNLNFNNLSVNLLFEILDKKIYNFIHNLEDLIIDNFIENKSWLTLLDIDLDSTKSDIQKYYANNILQNGNKNINLKIHYNKSFEFYCDIQYHKKNKEIINLKTINDLKKISLVNKKINLQIYISNVWIIKKNFGITIKLKKLIICDK